MVKKRGQLRKKKIIHLYALRYSRFQMFFIVFALLMMASIALYALYILISSFYAPQLSPGEYRIPGTLTFRGTYEGETFRNGFVWGIVGFVTSFIIVLVVVFFVYFKEAREIENENNLLKDSF